MTLGRFQVTIPRESNNPEDTIVNTWYFDVTGSFLDNLDLPLVGLQNFYNNLAVYIASDITTSDMRAKVYDMTQSEPRVPAYQGAVGSMNASSGGAPLPEELAMCLSFKGLFTSGQPNARRRGRIYVGALGNAVLPSSGEPRRPAAAFVTALAGAGQTLLNASTAATEWTWVVYSPTGNTHIDVIGGWVDNSWDIQRRRGLDPTTRTTFGA